MSSDITLEELWETIPESQRTFSKDQLGGLPAAARRYLEQAIQPGTPLATAVRLRMHGDIKLGKGWFPFRAEQVIRWDRGMIWRATARMYGLPIRGFDRLVDGAGAQRWKLLGLIPVVTASGPDVTRSTADRLHAEAIWLPSAFLGEDVRWTAQDVRHPQAQVEAHGHTSSFTLGLTDDGMLDSISMRRWGTPDERGFRSENFGGEVEEHGTFSGYTIPTRVRIGWYYGTDRFAEEGSFFRATIDAASFR